MKVDTHTDTVYIYIYWGVCCCCWIFTRSPCTVAQFVFMTSEHKTLTLYLLSSSAIIHVVFHNKYTRRLTSMLSGWQRHSLVFVSLFIGNHFHFFGAVTLFTWKWKNYQTFVVILCFTRQHIFSFGEPNFIMLLKTLMRTTVMSSSFFLRESEDASGWNPCFLIFLWPKNDFAESGMQILASRRTLSVAWPISGACHCFSRCYN